MMTRAKTYAMTGDVGKACDMYVRAQCKSPNS
jgi:hypothetical protein